MVALFEYAREVNTQYWHCVPEKYHAIVKLLNKFEVMLWMCYHVTMNGLHVTSFPKLTQNWRNNVIPTLRRRCEFDVLVTMLYWRFHYSIHDMLLNLLLQCWGNVGKTLYIWSRSVKVVKKLEIWHRNFKVANVSNTTFIVHL